MITAFLDIRLGTVCGFIGACLLAVGISPDFTGVGRGIFDWLDLNPASGFSPYYRTYILFHFAQLLGIVLIMSTFLLLQNLLADGRVSVRARLVAAGAVATIILTAVLQATGGIALALIADQRAVEADAAIVAITIGLIVIRNLCLGITFVFGMVHDDAGPDTLKRMLRFLTIYVGIVLIGSGLAINLVGFLWTGQGIETIAEVLLVMWALVISAAYGAAGRAGVAHTRG